MSLNDSSHDCPSCGRKAVVVYDSRVQGGRRWRRRKCQSCGHRWKTVEIAVDDVDPTEAVIQEIDRIIASVKALEALRSRLEKFRAIDLQDNAA